jgi:chromosome segregation protein
MYLEEVELYGFKTFVSNTKIILSKSITAIVGPNGSGKSNIVDSVRWILGETRLTLLRASETSDLIFSGSSTKSPLSVASVKMIFNNEDHMLPIKTPRFVIERRVYRNKESHYYFNGEESSLQNVLSIFNAGGIFGANFSIVGQGRVEEILLAKPEEKKAILDKVAGIERFRKKREEALKKLQETDENLVRVYDRLSELRKEANRIVSEAKKAHLYYLIVDKLKGLETTFYSGKISTLTKEIKLVKAGFETFNSEEKEINVLITKKKRDFEEVHNGLLDLNKQYDALKQKSNDHRVNSARLLEKENALRDKISMFEGKSTENKLRIEKLARTSEYLAKDLEKAIHEKTLKEDKPKELNKVKDGITASLDDLKSEIEPMLEEESEAKGRISKLTEERVKREKIISALSTDVRYLKNELASIGRQLGEASFKTPISEEEILSKMNETRTKKASLQKELSGLYEERSLLRYRINEVRKSISESSDFRFARDTLGALLSIRKLIPGIEEELKAQIVSSVDDVADKNEGIFFVMPNKGRLIVFSDRRAKPLNDVLKTDSIYLDGIYYAESLKNALDVFQDYISDYYIRKIITQDGFIVLSPFEIVAKKEITALKKREEADYLVQELKELDSKISLLETSVENSDNEIKNLERDLDKAKENNADIRNAENLLNNSNEIKKKISENESKIELETVNVKSIITSMVEFSSNDTLSNKRAEIDKKKEAIVKCEAEIRELIFEIRAIDHDIEEKKHRIASIKVEIEEVANLDNKTEIELLQEELKNTSDNLNSISLDIVELDENENLLKKSILEFEEKEDAINVDILRLSEQRESIVKKIEKANVQLAQKQTEIDALKREMEEKELKTSNVFNDVNVDKIKQEINNLKKEIADIGLIDFTSVDEEEKILAELNEKESVYNDVKTAKKELEKFIDETDKKIKADFEKTLFEVEKYFATFFKKMFLGGEASIEKLIDEEGEVRGIELNVRLPGKRKQSLSVLSGGEKAITALAFLFALFKVKPSPFYVLDEVDAALDEDNVVRFSELIQEESATAQFILITHNKETMQRADVLYGITMEEEGISKVVSMKLV